MVFINIKKTGREENYLNSVEKIAALLDAKSKHSSYQNVHPKILEKVGVQYVPQGKAEEERWSYMSRHYSFSDMRVLDIGANTGFFSVGAVLEGAREVLAVEGNTEHAQFIEASAELLQKNDILKVQNSYFKFENNSERHYDLTFCLNVLHHLGDDFGNPQYDKQQAKKAMKEKLRNLSVASKFCWFQLGFNWKGDRNECLFLEGSKRELVSFVVEACQGAWEIDEIAVFCPESKAYKLLKGELFDRFDPLGEFLNRPLFLLRSIQFSG